ncbi:oligosaccharide flippase family protein [Amnibacterium kyonggiense]|uniref:O-antigen/teichoic acid export membrane protein n=1 Tax=Amnibacterium kyonggiense TaxID=595671 RepID=A0A4R7FHS6_9MICO|nr:oligosaccharide flippase family protein [Amnibacterium kyonggiense]TDS74887.1 O-antigen/teichoic acid export membrane protein [Amnibacterium kyonggiense]
MADARRIARGAIWNYSAQIATALAQLAYAAVTSRLLVPHDFGVFAAATASVALINLVSLAGLPQVVGRMTDLHADRLVGLLAYAGVIGILAAAATFVGAPLWAAIWGQPESISVLQVLALTSLITPFVALGNGLSLRLGLFKRLAGATVVANVGSMVVGTVFVFLLRDAESLAVAQVLALLGVASIMLVQLRSYFRGRFHLRMTLKDVSYSTKTLVSALLTYSASTVGKVSVSHSVGSVALGNWNRADAITTNPFYLLGAAISQAVYPEFRHDIEDRSRTRRLWSDLLGVLGWVCVPLGVLVAVLAPIAVNLLLGDGYELAAQYAPMLAIIGALQPVVFLLVSGFEALGRFRWVWSGYIISLVVNTGAAGVAIALHSVWPVFIGFLVSFAIMHPLHLALASRAQLVDLRVVLRHYLEILAFCVVGGGALWTLVNAPAVIAFSPFVFGGVLLVAIVAAALVVKNIRRFPPLVLAKRYGLLGGREVVPPVALDVEPETVQR